jgi:hypothetical protein
LLVWHHFDLGGEAGEAGLEAGCDPFNGIFDHKVGFEFELGVL